MITKIIGTGSSLPAQIVTNDDLAKIMETSDEWITSRTGIKERRLVKEETTTSMAVEASRRAIENAGISVDELDLIIVGTITADHITPSTACEIQAELGAIQAVAFDINAACSGFLFALHTAHAYLQSGLYKTVLIIGAETLSKIMDWNDRRTCVLFGDGAGAAIIQAFPEGENGSGLLAFDQGSDGERGKVLACPSRPNNNPFVQTPYLPTYLAMDGQEVYKFAVTAVPASIQKVLAQGMLTAGDIDYFILHQANLRIIQSVAKRLGEPIEKFPICLDHYGNVSAGSVPILLDEMNKKGLLRKGNKIVLSGFGAGLTWGTSLLEW